MTDTHTHLYLPEFDADGQCDAVDRALAAGVDTMIFPNVDCSTIGPMRRLHAMRPDATYMAMGLHPTEIGHRWQADLAVCAEEIRTNAADYIAVGEVGMDLYWDKTFEKAQSEAFDMQCALARELGLPLIIHCREALPQTLEVLEGHPGLQAVFHSFGGSAEDVDRIRRRGDYYFGINGIVTFKNSKLREVLPHIGIERILTETDSPYLAPVPRRGRRNESAYLPYIVSAIAEALAIEREAVASATSAGAARLFALTPHPSPLNLKP